jgi:hypothetical protein
VTFVRALPQKARSSAPKPEISDEVLQILHRVGLALIIFGLLDIGLMIYCIVNSVSYSSSFNIFAVISGIYLWRGHPWYVKWVTRAAGFYAAAFCAMVPMAPFLFPVDLGVLELRLHPAGVIVGTVATIGVVVFLVWVYRELRQAPVLAAYTVAGYSPGQYWVAPALRRNVGPRCGCPVRSSNARRRRADGDPTRNGEDGAGVSLFRDAPQLRGRSGHGGGAGIR